MIAVTGMHRSGTSCIAGLLNKCGYELGTSHPLLNNNESRLDNKKGHYENIGALLINDKIIELAGGTWYNPPVMQEITLAGIKVSPHIKRFSETFNGNLIKIPRLCLTVALWERYCRSLYTIVYCLRSPIGVAISLKKRNGIPLEAGLRLWYEYNIRFLNECTQTPVVVVDYDNLKINFEYELTGLLEEIGSPLTAGEILDRVDGFYNGDLNHDPTERRLIEKLPGGIRRVYEILRSKTFSYHNGSVMV